MNKDRETPESQRERLRQEEIKRNPAGNVSDAFDRVENGNLADLAGGLSWKVTGVICLILIGFFAAFLFLSKKTSPGGLFLMQLNEICISSYISRKLFFFKINILLKTTILKLDTNSIETIEMSDSSSKETSP